LADRVVIVGAGQGGFQAAASLRQEGFSGRVTLVGDEPGLPYQRPPLSKAYMKDGDPKRLALRAEAFFADAGIERVKGRVVAIDRAARRVVLGDGEALAYDHLILATGARNAVPPVAGLAEAVESRAVAGLRTLADAAFLRERIAAGGRAVVIGGAAARGGRRAGNAARLTREPCAGGGRAAIVGRHSIQLPRPLRPFRCRRLPPACMASISSTRRSSSARR